MGSHVVLLTLAGAMVGGAVFLVVPAGTEGRAKLGERTSVTRYLESLSKGVHAFLESPSDRRGRCLREMPELLDIVTLGLAAGLSFDAALSLYCARYDTELSHSFLKAIRSWQMGVTSRSEALDALADELDVAAVRRFSSAVSEALSFGSPLASVLEQQSQAIRDEQRAQVEEEIEKVPIKMLIPMGTLIVPAMLLAILGPLLASATKLG